MLVSREFSGGISLKYFLLISAIFVLSCSHTAKNARMYAVAFDSSDNHNVKAAAVKKTEKQGVCFEITVWMKNSPEARALPSHWTAAWVDEVQHYHLFTINQRNPASLPKGSEEEWKNTFTGCAPRAEFKKVSGIVLTPKEGEDSDGLGLHLSWKR